MNERLKELILEANNRFDLNDLDYNSLMDKLEKELVEMRKNGEINESEYQEAIDLIFDKGVDTTKRTYLGNWQFSREGFFQNLKAYVHSKASNKISDDMKLNLTEYTWNLLFQEKIDKIIESETWISYFGNCPYLKTPEPFDIETTTKMHDWELTEFLRILIFALKQFCENSLETSVQCLTLHEYYILLKNEALSRNSLKDCVSPQDSYVEWIKNKSTYQAQAQALQSARLTGSICIFCGSKNVHSKGKEWICWDCKRRFSKHF
jgi:hypothetical protein